MVQEQPPQLASFPSLFFFSNTSPVFELGAFTVAATVSLLNKSGKVNYQCVDV